MPSTRDIRRRIKSVKNLAQITRAMEMVSASRLRRAQRNVLATRPYADRILEVMSELTARNRSQRSGGLLEVRSNVKAIAVILVTPDRGLAGSLVSNVLRRLSRFMLDERQKGRMVDLIAVGKKGRDFAVRNKLPLVAEIIKLGDFPSLENILGAATVGINGFRDATYDEVYVLYAEFVNTLVQRPRLKR
ncbi:MAG: F0F1 ATP synthase subunit gamma, partial [Roseiflexaceae bacterium]|nr:F0F1 ATP synthase subunit gamma [Roseiflexaceae bacterium]